MLWIVDRILVFVLKYEIRTRVIVILNFPMLHCNSSFIRRLELSHDVTVSHHALTDSCCCLLVLVFTRQLYLRVSLLLLIYDPCCPNRQRIRLNVNFIPIS